MWCVLTVTIFSSVLSLSDAQVGDKEQFVGSDQETTITNLTITSDVSARFANVVVRSVVENDDFESHEASFVVQMPNTAFISNFTMLIGNDLITGQVRDKEEAKKMYEKAKESGETAGHISQRPPDPEREMEIFNVNINVANKSSVIFELTYQELIQRKLGSYVQRISVDPNQVVTNLKLVAQYFEPQGFEYFEYTRPSTEEHLDHSVSSVQLLESPKKRELVYEPSLAEQRAIDSSKGMNGEFVVRYDISHKKDGGLMIVDKDYFVHYFSPSGLISLDKNIVFVIDISGSMSGHKIEQVRQAMLTILGKLKVHDHFNILLFDTDVELWATEPMQANAMNLENARSYVLQNVEARGGTNINSALLGGISTLELSLKLAGNRGNIIVFLTDGQPTVGVTNTTEIRKNVKYANEARVCIYSLGFGFNVNFDFLKFLSWENCGFARRIYEESDAAKQLERLYDEISSPLLIDVQVNYDNDIVDTNDISDTHFPQYFNGSELIIAGRFKSEIPADWAPTVSGKSRNEQNHFEVSPQTIQPIGPANEDFTERLWAYMKIKSLIKKSSIIDDEDIADSIMSRALNMSIQYNFVTPLTSMIVTQEMRDDSADDIKHENDQAGWVGPNMSKTSQTSNYLQSAHMPRQTLNYPQWARMPSQTSNYPQSAPMPSQTSNYPQSTPMPSQTSNYPQSAPMPSQTSNYPQSTDSSNAQFGLSFANCAADKLSAITLVFCCFISLLKRG